MASCNKTSKLSAYLDDAPFFREIKFSYHCGEPLHDMWRGFDWREVGTNKTEMWVVAHGAIWCPDCAKHFSNFEN